MYRVSEGLHHLMGENEDEWKHDETLKTRRIIY